MNADGEGGRSESRSVPDLNKLTEVENYSVYSIISRIVNRSKKKSRRRAERKTLNSKRRFVQKPDECGDVEK